MKDYVSNHLKEKPNRILMIKYKIKTFVKDLTYFYSKNIF